MRKRTRFAPGLVALLVWASPVGAEAQDEGALPATFTSDRPGFANTTGVAAVGRLTTEAGILAAFDDESPRGELPRLALRVGLFDWLEARVLGPGAVGDFGPDGPRFGMSDPSLGFKIGGQLHETLWMSVDWQVSLPLGTDDFGAPEAELFADLNVDWNFWGPLWLTPNAVAWVRAGTDPSTGETIRYVDGGGSLKLSWQVIDVLGLYAQSYVLKSALESADDWRIQVGGGLYWRVAPNAQLDASFDIGVTEGTDLPPTAAVGTTILW